MSVGYIPSEVEGKACTVEIDPMYNVILYHTYILISKSATEVGMVLP